ncbi:MAG TPA: diphthine synthase [Thermoplasmata archaeon]|nr:diphthine synthase [Thermoplasmata archaeon]
MGELLFIGLGLGNETDLSRRTVTELRGAGALFAEEYTSAWTTGSLERLSAELGRTIVKLSRSELERETSILAALEEHRTVALVVPGDPFVATTHVALRVTLEGRGHTWRYLPGTTVLTAVPSLLGLQHYRFGRTVSLPFDEAGYRPRSPLEAIAANRGAGLHTRVLLDLAPDAGRFLTADRGLRMLVERDDAAPRVFSPGLEVGVVARVGRPDAEAWWGAHEALERRDFGPPLHSIVVPAPELHFVESSAVARWKIEQKAAP